MHAHLTSPDLPPTLRNSYQAHGLQPLRRAHTLPPQLVKRVFSGKATALPSNARWIGVWWWTLLASSQSTRHHALRSVGPSLCAKDPIAAAGRRPRPVEATALGAGPKPSRRGALSRLMAKLARCFGSGSTAAAE